MCYRDNSSTTGIICVEYLPNLGQTQIYCGSLEGGSRQPSCFVEKSFSQKSAIMGDLLKGVYMFIHPHYIFNLLLSVVFFLLKTVEPVCSMIFDDCQLELVSCVKTVYYRSEFNCLMYQVFPFILVAIYRVLKTSLESVLIYSLFLYPEVNSLFPYRFWCLNFRKRIIVLCGVLLVWTTPF